MLIDIPRRLTWLQNKQLHVEAETAALIIYLTKRLIMLIDIPRRLTWLQNKQLHVTG